MDHKRAKPRGLKIGRDAQKTEQRNNRYWVAMDIKSKVWVLMSIMLTKSALI